MYLQDLNPAEATLIPEWEGSFLKHPWELWNNGNKEEIYKY